jgi:hypothetical protein
VADCFRLRVAALLVLWAASFTGCAPAGPAYGIVRGKVTSSGQVVSGGTIAFDNGKGVTLIAPIGADGTYEMRTYEHVGLPVGSYKVAVSPTGMDVGNEQVLAGANIPAPPSPKNVPEKYHRVEISPLTAQVQAGENPPFNFDLK